MEDMVNKERGRVGLEPVVLDENLCRLAGMKAEDMRKWRYFGHRSDRLGSMTELVETYLGDVPRVAENIAMNFLSDEAVHQAWMCSALHRKNILNSGHESVGYAWVELEGSGRLYVQVFTGRE